LGDSSLDTLLDTCQERDLIDGYEDYGDTVRIRKQEVVYFSLTRTQARTFLTRLLDGQS
jgi:hypothetical protein